MSKKKRAATKRDVHRLEERLTARLGAALAVLLAGLAVTTAIVLRQGMRNRKTTGA